MFSSVSLGSALGKIHQLPSADRSSGSAILKVCPPDLWVFLRSFQSLKGPTFFIMILRWFLPVFFLCHAAHSFCHDDAKVLAVRTAGALAQTKVVALKCASCHAVFTSVHSQWKEHFVSKKDSQRSLLKQ